MVYAKLAPIANAWALRLRRDLYGEIHFPLQAIVLLDRPGTDFQGGEWLLVEQRPRRQSRPIVVPLTGGAAPRAVELPVYSGASADGERECG